MTEPPRTSPQQDGGLAGTARSSVGPPDPSPTFPTIRGVEIGIVVLVLLVWVGAIALFFNRWGKIRMLLPYQPDYKQEQLKVPGSSALAAAAAGGNCAHSAPSACSVTILPPETSLQIYKSQSDLKLKVDSFWMLKGIALLFVFVSLFIVFWVEKINIDHHGHRILLN
ncbi:hypothetical protein MSG28_010124 [Choristoneura fumiferana]|uniref:Uncharacterized protein n=1 Tax=Choristoneura fumiferana TaxID=7141 RepID=A0ACC0KJX9_CHOFU|nr:hypothetical protein MSG28_010124 [Choristoneura fumiferana]